MNEFSCNFQYIGYDTKNTLEHFGEVAFTPWVEDLFSGTVFVINITEWRMNGYSLNFQDMDTKS